MPLSLKPSEMAASIAPEIAAPAFCATTGAASACIARSFRLSAGVLTDWISAAEVLVMNDALPP